MLEVAVGMESEESVFEGYLPEVVVLQLAIFPSKQVYSSLCPFC